MITEIDPLASKLGKISIACRANDVKRLEVFGSLARTEATAASDADFLVEFNDPLRKGVFDRYLDLRESLQSILGCPVDLVESSSVQNPIFRRRIDQDRKLVYAA